MAFSFQIKVDLFCLLALQHGSGDVCFFELHRDQDDLVHMSLRAQSFYSEWSLIYFFGDQQIFIILCLLEIESHFVLIWWVTWINWFHLLHKLIALWTKSHWNETFWGFHIMIRAKAYFTFGWKFYRLHHTHSLVCCLMRVWNLFHISSFHYRIIALIICRKVLLFLKNFKSSLVFIDGIGNLLRAHCFFWRGPIATLSDLFQLI